ncbi:MAG TPA: hypothetical protein VK498_09870 [Ferruginibacter sp.]|nr:hypothetical protein [Ferruginibacter sp.]
MNYKTTIQLKAAFLLMVFSLNTIIGFACAVGLDMNFNSKHHHDEQITEAVIHIHKDGKKHIHHEKKGHHNNKSSGKHHEKNNGKTNEDKENCCNEKVKDFQQLDKAVPGVFSLIHALQLTAALPFYNIIIIPPHHNIVKDIKPFVRSYHPPIQDIRIAIRSFQI